MSNTLTQVELAQFTGTDHWYRHGINRRVLLTDGAKYMAERAGAHWLLDEIALIQPVDKRVATEAFQVWKPRSTLTAAPSSSARTATMVSFTRSAFHTQTFRSMR
jgi:hypothetical protein